MVSDVDGTMVTRDKTLTAATIAAADRLRAAGIPLALVSSRPPRGVAFLAERLGLHGPFGSFNGATIMGHDGSLIEQLPVPEAAVRTTLALLERRGVSAWLFADNEWFVRDLAGDYVEKERRTVRFDPIATGDFTPYIARCGKVVGVSRDFDLLARCEAELQGLLGATANAHRSQRYYLDITHPDADKGTALRSIACWYGVDPAEVAGIGDMTNDVPLFEAAGLSIAMGNAPPEVAALAMARTASNEDEGWAQAIDALVLPRAAKES